MYFTFLLLIVSLIKTDAATNITNVAEAEALLRKFETFLFYGFRDDIKDTAYATEPSTLTSAGYTLRPVKMRVILPNIYLYLNGGEYKCMQKTLINMCNLTPLYTFYDSSNNNTYIAKNKLERRLTRMKYRSKNVFIGYASKTPGLCGTSINATRIHVNNLVPNRLDVRLYVPAGLCGTSINATRIHVNNLVPNRLDVRLYVPADVVTFVNQNNNNPELYAHKFYTGFINTYPNPAGSTDGELAATALNSYKTQNKNLEGNTIDPSIICDGDLDDQVEDESDYIDSYYDSDNYDQFGNPTTTPDKDGSNLTPVISNRTGCITDISYEITFPV
uniref:Conserved secreted protein n=1 Tax=Parastrongyloides trichosuri TaxID=131310 RepID=A0A0N5A6E7_PARTI